MKTSSNSTLNIIIMVVLIFICSFFCLFVFMQYRATTTVDAAVDKAVNEAVASTEAKYELKYKIQKDKASSYQKKLEQMSTQPESQAQTEQKTEVEFQEDADNKILEDIYVVKKCSFSINKNGKKSKKKLKNGTKFIEVKDTGNGILYFETEKGIKGYVDSYFTNYMNPSKTIVDLQYAEGSTTKKCKMYSKPSLASSVITTIWKNTDVKMIRRYKAVKGSSRDWIRLLTEDGFEGYVPSEYVQKDEFFPVNEDGSIVLNPTPSPKATNEPENNGSAISAPEVTNEPENNGSATTAPEVTSEPENNGSATSTPEVTSEPENNGSSTSAPEATSDPENNGSSTTAPEVTSEPENNGSSTLAPELLAVNPIANPNGNSGSAITTTINPIESSKNQLGVNMLKYWPFHLNVLKNLPTPAPIVNPICSNMPTSTPTASPISSSMPTPTPSPTITPSVSSTPSSITKEDNSKNNISDIKVSSVTATKELPVYEEATKKSRVIGHISSGERAKVLSIKNNGYLYVKSGKTKGYIHYLYTTFTKNVKAKKVDTNTKYAKVAGVGVNLRTAPGVTSNRITTLLDNDLLKVKSAKKFFDKEKTLWYEVEVVRTNTKGYICGRYVKEISEKEFKEQKETLKPFSSARTQEVETEKNNSSSNSNSNSSKSSSKNNSSSNSTATKKDGLYWLSHAMQQEAGGSGDKELLYVGQVIINRTKKYHASVREVLAARGQYPTTYRKICNNEVHATKHTIELAKKLLGGYNGFTNSNAPKGDWNKIDVQVQNNPSSWAKVAFKTAHHYYAIMN